MRKVYLILAMAIATSLPGTAQDEATGSIVLYDTSIQDYTVQHVSPNGKWACGYYLAGSSTYSYLYYAFRWNLESNEITLMPGADSQYSMAWKVSNDGTVSGSAYCSGVSSNGSTVLTAAYWKDGSWQPLEEGYDEGDARCISPDGQWMAGARWTTGLAVPCVWRGDSLYKDLADPTATTSHYSGYADAVSSDGSLAAGWSYAGLSTYGRRTVLWDVESGELKLLSSDKNIYNDAYMFTSDDKYLLYYGDGRGRVWDIVGDSSILVPFVGASAGVDDIYYGDGTDLYDLTCYCIDDSVRVYSLETTLAGDYVSSVSMPLRDTAVTLDSYLAERGVDLSGYPVNYFLGVRGCSADGKVLAVATADSTGYEIPMIIMLDQNVTTREPAGLSATQVDGLMAVRLTWSAPITNPTNLTGYNVYRDGVLVNPEPLTSAMYYDTDLEAGEHTYAVSAVYDGGTESSLSTEATLSVSEQGVSAPRSLSARQKGYNSAALTWTAPSTNLVSKHYHDTEATLTGMGGGTYSFEAAIKYDADEMALYDGYSISQVTFVPQSEQTQWEIKIYGGDELVYSQVVTQELSYGVENTVTLDEPVAVSSLGGDLYCAIAITVASSSYDVIGCDFSNCTAGYSDLIHLAEESEFYSMSESSRNNGYVYDLAFAISAVLTPPDTDVDGIDDVAQYNVYSDGALVGTSTTESYVESGLADGTHTFAVEAEYTDGRVSPQTTVSVDITANESVFTSIDNVSLWGDGNEIAFSWKKPVDDDAQTVGYCDEDNLYQVIDSYEDYGWGYMARTIYPSSMFSGLTGYEITKLRFYVANDAAFTLYLYQGETMLFELPVDDYTVGAWNTVELDEPVAIVSGMSYTYDIDCFDGVETGGPLAVDGSAQAAGYANLYSVDGGESFSQFTGTGRGNWMMDLVIADPDGGLLPVDGYNVRIDGETVTPSLISDNYYIHTFGTSADQSATHTVAVDVTYTGYGEVQGAANHFTLGGVAEGIEDAVTAEVRVYPNPATSYVVAEGDGVEGMSAYSLGGVLMGKTTGNRLNVSSYSPGLYILKVKAGSKTQTVKLNVIR